jgi:hypothetical protein
MGLRGELYSVPPENNPRRINENVFKIKLNFSRENVFLVTSTDITYKHRSLVTALKKLTFFIRNFKLLLYIPYTKTKFCNTGLFAAYFIRLTFRIYHPTPNSSNRFELAVLISKIFQYISNIFPDSSTHRDEHKSAIYYCKMASQKFFCVNLKRTALYLK